MIAIPCWFTCFVQIANSKLFLSWFAKLAEQFQAPKLHKTRKSTENRLLGNPKVQWSRKNKVGSIYQGWERRGPLPFYKISCLPRNRFLWTTNSLDPARYRPPTSNLMLTDWSREVTHPLWSYSLEWHCALVLILAILALFFRWSQISAVTSSFFHS